MQIFTNISNKNTELGLERELLFLIIIYLKKKKSNSRRVDAVDLRDEFNPHTFNALATSPV